MYKNSIFFIILIIATVANATPPIIKLDEKAANGDCLPQLDDTEALAVLDKYQIKFSGHSLPPDRLAVARVLASIDDLSGGKCGLPKGAAFAFRVDNKGISRFNGEKIEINAGSQNVAALRPENKHSGGGCNNAGLIAHELCHRMGHQGVESHRGRTAYELYRKRVPNKCAITNYAIHNTNENPRNEEFAEVCSAFITNPELIVNNPTIACQNAIDFFKEIIGDQSRSTSCVQKKPPRTYQWLQHRGSGSLKDK